MDSIGVCFPQDQNDFPATAHMFICAASIFLKLDLGKCKYETDREKGQHSCSCCLKKPKIYEFMNSRVMIFFSYEKQTPFLLKQTVFIF